MQKIDETNAAEVAAIQKKLLAPFPPEEVKTKPGATSGDRAMVIHYIDARCVMDRLDEAVGWNHWRDEYTLLPGGEVECRLSIRIGGEWLTRCDVGGQSEQPDEGDRCKAAYSDSLKRAAVKFGVGRYLYRMKQEWRPYDKQKKRFADTGPAKQSQPNPAAQNERKAADFARRMAEAATAAELRKIGEELKGAGLPESILDELAKTYRKESDRLRKAAPNQAAREMAKAARTA
jgi:hypothetical protein